MPEKPSPLSTVKRGEIVTVVSVEAGRGLKGRLAAMGLLPNEQITVVNNGYPGPFVITVKGTKVILGRGMAHRIMVV